MRLCPGFRKCYQQQVEGLFDRSMPTVTRASSLCPIYRLHPANRSAVDRHTLSHHPPPKQPICPRSYRFSDNGLEDAMAVLGVDHLGQLIPAGAV